MIDGTENTKHFDSDETVARKIWDIYVKAAGGKTYDGKPLPTWDELGEERQRCWFAVAEYFNK